MGNGVTVASQQNVGSNQGTTTIDIASIDIGSNEILQCVNCKNEFEKLSKCKQCKKQLCPECCVHSDQENSNPFFGSNLSATETQTLMIKSSKASQQKVRCATLVKDGQLAILSQLYYGSSYRYESFKWKLCYLHDKPKCVTKKKTKDDINIIFPGDICYIKTKRELYLTLPCQQMVYKLPDGEDFQDAFYNKAGSCFGIASFDNGLALSVEIPKRFHEIPNWQIQYVDFKGNVKHRIQNEGEILFCQPLYLNSNSDGTILYVSDKENGSVMAFSVDGRLMFRSDSQLVKDPRGITADKYNNVYVACGSKVIQIKAGGGEYKSMLEVCDRDTIVSVCMDQTTNTLFTISEQGKVSSFVF